VDTNEQLQYELYEVIDKVYAFSGLADAQLLSFATGVNWKPKGEEQWDDMRVKAGMEALSSRQLELMPQDA
jgi:hypothetical protein